MYICETVKTRKQYYLHHMRSAYFPIDMRLCRERESKRERLCPSVKQWKHRNGTISVIHDLHISLLIGDWIEREAMSICEMWKSENSTISIIWDQHIPLSLGDCVCVEREAMSICEKVKTQKWYYVWNMRSAYFPIDMRLHREWEREAMSICETMKTQKWY